MKSTKHLFANYLKENSLLGSDEYFIPISFPKDALIMEIPPKSLSFLMTARLSGLKDN